MSDDPYSFGRDAFLFETRLMFGLHRPTSHVYLPPEDLPEPLQRASRQMQASDLTDDERKAAAQEFLTLSEEWVDGA